MVLLLFRADRDVWMARKNDGNNEKKGWVGYGFLFLSFFLFVGRAFTLY